MRIKSKPFTFLTAAAITFAQIASPMPVFAHFRTCQPQVAGAGGFGYSTVDCSAGNANANCAGSGDASGGTNTTDCYQTRYTAGVACQHNDLAGCTDCLTTWRGGAGAYANGNCSGMTQSCVCTLNGTWIPATTGINAPTCNSWADCG